MWALTRGINRMCSHFFPILQIALVCEFMQGKRLCDYQMCPDTLRFHAIILHTTPIPLSPPVLFFMVNARNDWELPWAEEASNTTKSKRRADSGGNILPGQGWGGTGGRRVSKVPCRTPLEQAALKQELETTAGLYRRFSLCSLFHWFDCFFGQQTLDGRNKSYREI